MYPHCGRVTGASIATSLQFAHPKTLNDTAVDQFIVNSLRNVIRHNAARLADELAPKIVERLQRYEVQAALLIPASRLCHQSVGLLARAIEASGIPTMTLAVTKDIAESVRPPRVALHNGELGSVAGKPNWPEHQRRILDEALRWIEPMDQPGMRNLVVELQTQVETARGER